ncbi:hypothetical protein N7454_010698 [Penicillium verhagenii]|nr:hypothetical protein N7454_010698 [Penicillium verhagenii]
MSIQYCIDKCLVVILRTIISIVAYFIRGGIKSYPDEVRHIPSRDTRRTIKVHVYTSSAPNPSPVLINFHGSGFVLPHHGSDDEFCRQVSQQTKCTVLDVRYRLAPEHPFPAALNDVEDTINYVLGRPHEFDRSRLSLSGFSAGANLVLAASANLFAPDTFRSLVAFYPVTDLNAGTESKTAPNPTQAAKIPAPLARLFNRCYVPAKMDPRDPRISPTFAQVDRFPRRVLMITADGDNLAHEAEEIAGRLQKLQGWHVVSQRMVGCSHGWDKSTRPSSPQHLHEAKKRAYQLAVEMLNG